MTHDPREGVTPDGYLTTGVDAGNVGPPYDAVIADALQRLQSVVGADLDGIYLYGSVATGQARPPTSDLDLYVVTVFEVGDRCRPVAAELSAAHAAVVRAVGIATVTLEQVRAASPSGVAERCFLRHYCILLEGRDLRPHLPRCRATTELAVGMSGDVLEVAHAAARRAEHGPTDAEGERLVRYACRRLLMALATLLSVQHGTWSTDRATAVDLVAAARPGLAAAATQALRWSHRRGDLPSGGEVGATLRALAGLVAESVPRSGP